MTKPTPEDIKALIDTFDSSTWSELHIRSDEFELHLGKEPGALSRLGELGNTSPEPRPIAPPTIQSAAADAGRPAAVIEPAADAVPEGMLVVRAPNLGTFYKAPKPGAPPYVEIGDKVEPDTEICVIEVMKLFTPVRAGVAGIVRKVFVNDTELVEFDQPLFMIEPIDQ